MHDFIGTILYFFRNAIPLALIGLAAGAVILVMLNLKCRREGKCFPKGQAVAFLLLLCYLGGLAAITLMNRMDGMRTGVQLLPFLAFWEAWNNFTLQIWLNPLLNIAMFLPLGVLLPLAVKHFRRWFWMLTAGVGTSLVIELLQYVLGRGQADVDDLICNVLGAMLGYCFCMLFVSLVRKQWKTAGVYVIFPVLSIAAIAGVFLTYHFRPYGNLADGPIYNAKTKEIEWVQECSLSNEPGPSGVYRTEPFTRKDCDAFASEFVGRQGAEIRFGTPDVDYYDSRAFYSDHRTYALWVYYNDHSYEYTDYRVDSEQRYSEKGGAITEDGLRAALDKLGIEIPDAASFVIADESAGRYAFRAECVVENDVLTNGELVCWVAEGGILYKVDNHLSVSTLHGNAAVISSQEAYERLCAGQFSWRDVPMFNYLSPRQVRVTDCKLEYMTDSKGFHQPVYLFTLSDENDAALRGGTGWTTFVPALAG